MRAFVLSGKRKRLISACAVIMAVIGIGLLISGKQPLYGQVGGGRIPNLVGAWRGSVSGCFFANVWESSAQPDCDARDDTVDVTIVKQNGWLFAGKSPVAGAKDKITGVLLPDGTVMWQAFDPDKDERVFAIGTLRVERGTYVMSGYANTYQEVSRLAQPFMGTMYFSFSKR